MADQISFENQARLVVIGRRYGSDLVALEATEAGARWARDQAALGAYGFGAKVLARFEDDRSKHAALRVSRSNAVASKKISCATRDEQISRGWAWIDRVLSMLGVLSLTDGTLAAEIAAAKPTDDAGLQAGILAMAKLLIAHREELDTDSQSADRLAEAEPLATAVASSPGPVQTSKGQTVADTAQIDLLDGKLYVWIRELNKAGRRAIRNGHLQAAPQEYVFHHLKHSGSSTPHSPTPEPPAPVPVTQAATPAASGNSKPAG